jgi:hypothetical protein
MNICENVFLSIVLIPQSDNNRDKNISITVVFPTLSRDYWFKVYQIKIHWNSPPLLRKDTDNFYPKTTFKMYTKIKLFD